MTKIEVYLSKKGTDKLEQKIFTFYTRFTTSKPNGFELYDQLTKNKKAHELFKSITDLELQFGFKFTAKDEMFPKEVYTGEITTGYDVYGYKREVNGNKYFSNKSPYEDVSKEHYDCYYEMREPWYKAYKASLKAV
jgi:hypothetical protein